MQKLYLNHYVYVKIKIIMDKKPNEIHENLTITYNINFYKTVNIRTYLITGQP